MRWIMRKEFEIAYNKANEINEKINCSENGMIRTASIIDAVEKALNVDVLFTDYDFGKIVLNTSKIDPNKFGAAMGIIDDNGKKRATILINEKESAKMKRFSLVHELGHLMTKPLEHFEEYRISTHIDMDITSIPDEILENNENSFLVDEQCANIFALLVLIPFTKLIRAIDEFDTLEKVADFFGVEKEAVISRLLLEDAQKALNA